MNNTATNGMKLGVFTLIALLLLITTNALTREHVSRIQQALLLKSLSVLLPAGPYDASPLTSKRLITATALGPTNGIPLYTVYRNKRPLGAVLSITAPDGYNGDINLLLGVDYQGSIIGVRVTAHTETPGLGDDLELKRSNWITLFNGQSLNTTTSNDWQVKKQGGQFDGFTGATVTPNAVITAVYRALQWYEENRSVVFP